MLYRTCARTRCCIRDAHNVIILYYVWSVRDDDDIIGVSSFPTNWTVTTATHYTSRRTRLFGLRRKIIMWVRRTRKQNTRASSMLLSLWLCSSASQHGGDDDVTAIRRHEKKFRRNRRKLIPCAAVTLTGSPFIFSARTVRGFYILHFFSSLSTRNVFDDMGRCLII